MDMLATFPKVAATYRRGTTVYTNGRPVITWTANTPILIIAPQPTPGAQLQLLPEGERVYQHKSTWANTALIVEDVVTYGGEDYKVTLSEDWGDDGEYHRVLMRKVQS